MGSSTLECTMLFYQNFTSHIGCTINNHLPSVSCIYPMCKLIWTHPCHAHLGDMWGIWSCDQISFAAHHMAAWGSHALLCSKRRNIKVTNHSAHHISTLMVSICCHFLMHNSTYEGLTHHGVPYHSSQYCVRNVVWITISNHPKLTKYSQYTFTHNKRKLHISTPQMDEPLTPLHSAWHEGNERKRCMHVNLQSFPTALKWHMMKQGPPVLPRPCPSSLRGPIL